MEVWKLLKEREEGMPGAEYEASDTELDEGGKDEGRRGGGDGTGIIAGRFPEGEMGDRERKVGCTSERRTPEVPQLLEAGILVEAGVETSDARDVAL